jgi:sigma-B regulation protein RsbU (phosphoserine phosphatase)
VPLSELHEDLEDLYENAPCGYISLTPDGRIAKLNYTLAGWLQRSAHDIVGRRVTEILGFGGRIAFETHLAPMLRLQGEVAEIALDLLDAGGDRVPTIANAAEKRDGDGNHISTRITLFKAVDRRRYERSLIEARDKAEHAASAEHETAQLREQFIAVLGHDLRNPLAAIGAGMRLLVKEDLSERGRLILNDMEKSVSRANLLIGNVLDFARGRLGQGLTLQRDAKEPLTPVLEQVVAEVRAISPDREIITDFELREPVDCDRGRFGQLAANLISNAITHGDPTIPIRVEACSVGEDLVFSVTNGGAPISAKVRKKLFQPFFRGSARQSEQGLGLGLFIVSEIAKAHGGDLDVVSSDESTRFTFKMPQRQTA